MSVGRYALIKDSEVINIIDWDPEEPYTPEEGTKVVEVDENIQIGCRQDNDNWIFPEPPPAVELPTVDQSVLAAQLEGVRQLVTLGISKAVARAIVGLPPE